MRHTTLLVALSAVTAAAAQNFTINPSEVTVGTRSDWCGAEYNTCRTLCGGNPTRNECNVNTLAYNCTCSNGTAPGLEYYIQTIPTFVCEQAYSDCIAANTGSSKAQDDCKTNIKNHCGTLDPSKAQVDSGSGTTTSAAPSSTKPASQTSAAGQAASSSSSKAGAAPTNVAYIGNGVAMVAAGVFAALL